MNSASLNDRHRIIQLDRASLEAFQLDKFNRLLADVLAHNEFYQRKLSSSPRQLESLDQLALLPHTTKEELQPAVGDEPFAANRTYAVERYVRCHQTSGTRGRPLVVLDTADDWRWWINCWQYVLDAAEITPRDRVLLAFSFGPFIGFWSAFDALVSRGALVIPGGGLGSLARIELIQQAGVTTLLSTPTYALRLAEVAAEHKVNLADSSVEKIIVAGEPGGSVPATRQRIETAWNARVIDHGGATEIGPWGFADAAGRGLHVNEAEFIAEFSSVETGHPAQEGELAHLILTTLGRTGAPVIRYRTGDLVRPVWHSDGPNRFVLLEGGILGRADDMVIVRGMNIYPTAIEQILHSFPEVVEYRITARKQGALDELIVEVEDHLQQPTRIANELRLKLGLKIDVHCVTAMSLPRFEGKGRRFIDERRERGAGSREYGPSQ
ncbi:MAG: AMP-binding protein [Planctomycetes bacterium]|nr:AMP-binding protein [Planctomycetota bacterium]